MRILLLGYGKMGRTIEKIALDRGHEIVGRIDVDNQHELDTIEADVAIEFSGPTAAFENITKSFERNIPVVSGSTGWLSKKHEADKICNETRGAFFYASNYSMGVNIFFKLNKFLAKMMDEFPEYEVRMDEIHHTEKKDAPSGTAITLAEGIVENLVRKTAWAATEGIAEENEIGIKSFRIDSVPGTHTVMYSSPIDDIEIRHVAHSREGFAKGAVLVAEWLAGKTGVFGMDDYLKF